MKLDTHCIHFKFIEFLVSESSCIDRYVIWGHIYFLLRATFAQEHFPFSWIWKTWSTNDNQGGS